MWYQSNVRVCVCVCVRARIMPMCKKRKHESCFLLDKEIIYAWSEWYLFLFFVYCLVCVWNYFGDGGGSTWNAKCHCEKDKIQQRYPDGTTQYAFCCCMFIV